MADKQYLCKCDMCDDIMFDENPGEYSILIDVTTIEKPVNHTVQFYDGSEFYWGVSKLLYRQLFKGFN